MGGGGGSCLIPPTCDIGGAGDPIKPGGSRPPGLRPGCYIGWKITSNYTGRRKKI